MPIMQSCDSPEKFPKILAAAIYTLIFVYSSYGLVSYLAYGTEIDEPLITEVIEPENPVMITVKGLYVISLFFTYPIMIYPTNQIIESWVFRSFKRSTRARYWLKNLSRFLVCLSSVYVAIALKDKLDKFFGLIGALLCAPLAFLMPAAIHLKLLAKSKSEKITDIVIICLSFVIFVFCSA